MLSVLLKKAVGWKGIERTTCSVKLLPVPKRSRSSGPRMVNLQKEIA